MWRPEGKDRFEREAQKRRKSQLIVSGPSNLGPNIHTPDRTRTGCLDPKESLSGGHSPGPGLISPQLPSSGQKDARNTRILLMMVSVIHLGLAPQSQNVGSLCICTMDHYIHIHIIYHIAYLNSQNWRSRAFLDCDSCGMTQGALIRNVADRQALYMQAKQPRSDRLYMTTLDTGRCSHSTCSLVVLIALYLTIPMAASRSTDSS